MHRMALSHRDNSDELETIFIWLQPSGRAVEVSEMQFARVPVLTTEQPVEAEKKDQESKPKPGAKGAQNGSCHDGKEDDEDALTEC